jgi:Ca2+-binding RTX toxin-like protein
MEREAHTVKRTALLIALMAAALIMVSGVALAKTFIGTDANNTIVGTQQADVIEGRGGNDVLRGALGADRISGGNGTDRQYGGRGYDVIDTDGGYKDIVDCGRGIDTAYVDSRDEVRNCERLR